MDVGVRELKQRLSEFLDRAQQGEIIRVTDRGVPKAVITAVPGSGQFSQGIADGWIRPGSSLGLVRTQRANGLRQIRDVLAEDRSE